MTPATPIRTLAAIIGLSLLFSAPPLRAGEPDAAAGDAAPAITVVKGGGVAEVYRQEGSEFAAFGPDGGAAAQAEAVELRVLRALRAATDIELVALATTAGETADLSCGSACVGGYAVRHRAAVAPGALPEVRETAAGWISERGAPASACAATWGHALKFSHDGYRYEVLLASDCGRYRILRGGVPVAEGQAVRPTALHTLDAQLDGGTKP